MGTKRKATDDIEFETPIKFSKLDEVLARGNNCLMMLNEIGIKGLKWNIEQIINAFPQRFRGSCQFTEPFAGRYEIIPIGFTFYAEGANKGICKHEIANKIVSVLSGKISYNKLKSYSENFISEGGSQMTDNFDNSNSESYSLNNNSNIQPTQVLPQSPIGSSHNTSPNKSNSSNSMTTMEDSVRIVNEKFKDLEYKFDLREEGYHCFVELRGFVFKGLGTSKKIAKRVVAAQILKKYLKLNFVEEKQIKTQEETESLNPDTQKIPYNRQKNFSNIIQSIVKNFFEKSVCNMEVQYSKRKVLSGIVISRQMKNLFPQYYKQKSVLLQDYLKLKLQSDNPANDNDLFTTECMEFHYNYGWLINPDDPNEILKLITLSSGTKCLSGNDLNPDGNVLNDCHAEVIAKRALQLFICKTIDRYEKSITAQPGEILYGCDILTHLSKNNQWVYRLKPDVKFHLYISSAPCGDSRIFLPQNPNIIPIDDSDEEQDEDSHPNRKNRGVLRTKIECGEGTIPIKMKHIQTWDGILGGERLLTMSCSDKVCLWNVLGLQGALLSNILASPIYMDSIIVGSMHHQEHMQRALFERAETVVDEEDWFPDMKCQDNSQLDEGELTINLDNDYCRSNDQFIVNKPLILSVTDQDERCPGKASNYSLNWILGEESFEIIHTAKGVTIDNTRSRLCKRNLFKSFLRVFKFLSVLTANDRGPDNENNGRILDLVDSVNSNLGGSNKVLTYCDFKCFASIPDYALGSCEYQRRKVVLFKFFESRQKYGRWIGKPMEQDWFSVRRK